MEENNKRYDIEIRILGITVGEYKDIGYKEARWRYLCAYRSRNCCPILSIDGVEQKMMQALSHFKYHGDDYISVVPKSVKRG